MYFCVLGCEEAEIDLVFMIDGSTSVTCISVFQDMRRLR